jgi:hypothetical protein
VNLAEVFVILGTLLFFLDLVLSFTTVAINRVLLSSLGGVLLGIGVLISMGGIHA